jgi:hypothetical protein
MLAENSLSEVTGLVALSRAVGRPRLGRLLETSSLAHDVDYSHFAIIWARS